MVDVVNRTSGMSMAPAERVSEVEICSASRERAIDKDKKRRALLLERVKENKWKAFFEKGRPQRDATMSTLRRLLDAVSYVAYRPQHGPPFHGPSW